jgi:hypothetical protein
VVFLVMRLVVLPLSAYPHPVTFKPLATVADLLAHMVLFAMPMTLAVGRTIQGRSSGRYLPHPFRGAARSGARGSTRVQPARRPAPGPPLPKDDSIDARS